MLITRVVHLYPDFGYLYVGGELAKVAPVGVECSVGSGKMDGEILCLLPFAFPRIVSGSAIALDSFDAALLFLIVGLGALSRRQRSLGFW